MAEKFTNFAETTLATSINTVATSIVLTDATNFPTTGKFRITIENEIIECSGRSGNTLTASLRGAESTTPATHAALVGVTHNLTAGGLVDRINEKVSTGLYSAVPAATEKSLYLPTDGPMLVNGDGTTNFFYGPVHRCKGWDQTGFSWVNQGTGVLTQRGSSWGLFETGSTGGDNLRCYMKNITFPCTATMCVTLCTAPSLTFSHFGIVAMEAATTKGISSSSDQDGRIGFVRWDSATVFNTGGKINIGLFSPATIWMRMQLTTTDSIGSISYNGYDYWQVYSQAHSAHVTPTRMGPFVSFSGSSAYVPQGMTIHEFTLT